MFKTGPDIGATASTTRISRQLLRPPPGVFRLISNTIRCFGCLRIDLAQRETEPSVCPNPGCFPVIKPGTRNRNHFAEQNDTVG
uniref:Uncharacterized protein n=1 Tax=Candidatus Kentrum eta TaxID=2126337 RepID=A0A450VAZ8_9GAMM|nr:MAG: hypothetical protein BECKH772B_GA0070898_100849 [Candidatus Kentron sp. H]VFK01948.1 MAG: hypothetical protein BECKH772C_GA0070978_100778 [Candidatus Kentron sp. H]